MTKNDKVKIVLIIIIIAIIAGLIGIIIYVNNLNNKNDETYVVKEDGTIVNTSENVLQKKTVNGIEIDNINVIEKDGVTEITGELKNVSGKRVEGFYVMIDLIDKNGQVLVGLGSYIQPVDKDGTGTFDAVTTGSYADIADMKIMVMQ